MGKPGHMKQAVIAIHQLRNRDGVTKSTLDLFLREKCGENSPGEWTEAVDSAVLEGFLEFKNNKLFPKSSGLPPVTARPPLITEAKRRRRSHSRRHSRRRKGRRHGYVEDSIEEARRRRKRSRSHRGRRRGRMHGYGEDSIEEARRRRKHSHSRRRRRRGRRHNEVEDNIENARRRRRSRSSRRRRHGRHRAEDESVSQVNGDLRAKVDNDGKND